MGETMSEYKMTMPQEVVRIINTLEEHGYEAYASYPCSSSVFMILTTS